MSESKDDPLEESPSLVFCALFKSTFAAFLGVQSDANRERDFKHGKMSHFIIMGIIFGVLFVLTIGAAASPESTVGAGAPTSMLNSSQPAAPMVSTNRTAKAGI